MTRRELAQRIDSRLTPRERLVLALYYCEGLTFIEIGRVLELPPETVMGIYHVAQVLLQ